MTRFRNSGRIDPNAFGGYVGDGNADATTALTRSINLFNESNNVNDVLDLAGHTYRINGLLPAITRSGGHIEGAGATFEQLSGDRVITFGDPGTRCEDVDVTNLDVAYPGGGGDLNQPAVWFRHTGDVGWSGGEFTGIARLARFGDGELTAARTTLQNVESSLGPNGLTQIGVIWIESARSIRLDDVHCNGTGASSGSMIDIRPTDPEGFVDTVTIDESSFQSWLPGSLTDGKQQGLRIDMRVGEVTNVNVKTTVLDHTSDSGVLIIGGVSDSVRRFHFLDLRTDADNGSMYRIDWRSGASLESVVIADGFGFVQSADHAIEVIGDAAGLAGLTVRDMSIASVGAAVKPSAIRAAGRHVSIHDNKVFRTSESGANTNFAALVELDQNTNVFTVHDNVGDAATAIIDPTTTALKTIHDNIAA